MKRKMITILMILILILMFSFLVLHLQASSAPGGGTCCPEYGAICYPDGGNPPVKNHYWRTDGKPCWFPPNG